MFYEENRHLEEEDMGFESPVYQITLYDKFFLVAIGKERQLIQKKNTYYFPIYLLNKTNVQTQIGAFQFESSKDTTEERMKPFLDSSGDLDLNRLGDPVFYSFSNYDYFHDITLDVTPMVIKELESEYIKNKSEKSADLKEESDEGELEEPNPFELTSQDVKLSATSIKTSKLLKDGIFTIDKTSIRIQMLPEESESMAQKIKKEFVQTERSLWIEKFMKNNKYSIVETNNNGDCLIDSIRIAYEQIGHKTTIAKLRALVAKEATSDKFRSYKDLYDNTVTEIEETAKELRRLEKENKNLKERLTGILKEDKSTREGIIKQATSIKYEHKALLEKQKLNKSFLSEFKHMEKIDTLEKFQEYIQTPSYWADDWAINVLEQNLNLKLIIFSNQAFDQDDLKNVLQCQVTSLEENEQFQPDYYVMVSYTGLHYELITYDSKFIFNYREIPYDVKVMIVIKCMERNSGLFSKIPEFKEFKDKLGIQQEDERESDEEAEEEGAITAGGGKINGLDKEVVFTFYDQANKLLKPGKGTNEKIPLYKIHDYSSLAVIPDWRKKLDDEYVSTFHLENKKWKTVEHYYQAAKFKKHNPHFYNQFSLDDMKSDIAKDIGLAKAAGSQYGIYKKGKKDIIVRPNTIRIDPDFYGSRKTEERERALYAKFSQNEELKHLLISTKNAILQHFIPKQKAEKDYLLMKVRDKLQREN